VFWIGIGHRGTLISAILFLFRQNWRTSINRFAEAMTIFAVICAGIFPGIHVGRPWLAYWMAPYPNQMAMWPNFRSPLLWDVFAVSTYATVSFLFWYVGMVPDLASFRDRAGARCGRSLRDPLAGWTGSNRQWHRYERAYLLLAGWHAAGAERHSVVSFDFATAQLRAGTRRSSRRTSCGGGVRGFAMVITLAIPAANCSPQRAVTMRHMENMCKSADHRPDRGLRLRDRAVHAWYSGNLYERFAFLNRMAGPYAWAYWIMVSCNVLVPRFLWSKRMRTNIWAMLFVALCVDVGMWFERFVSSSPRAPRFPAQQLAHVRSHLGGSRHAGGEHGAVPHAVPAVLRYLPMVAMAEVKNVMPQAHPGTGGGSSRAGGVGL